MTIIAHKEKKSNSQIKNISTLYVNTGLDLYKLHYKNVMHYTKPGFFISPMRKQSE